MYSKEFSKLMTTFIVEEIPNTIPYVITSMTTCRKYLLPYLNNKGQFREATYQLSSFLGSRAIYKLDRRTAKGVEITNIIKEY